MNMQPALDVIKKYEGLKLEAYLCPAGKWTVGYGATGKDITQKTKWTLEKAEQDLQERSEELYQRISDLCYPTALNNNELCALVCLVYNIGIGNFRSSTLLEQLHLSPLKKETVADQFLRWNKARIEGELAELAGLTKRRKEERELFLYVA